MKTLLKSLFSLVVVLLITVALFEAIVHFSFRYPAVSVLPLEVMRKIYLRELRNVIQVDPACAQYDDYVSYTLKPGSCVFRNMGEETHYAINSAGLRDDEDSLQAPRIVVLGDSFAMGWGVEQDQTFAAKLEDMTGSRVLNAGISSFGTAREARLLERLDLGSADYLVIQYCDNDVGENRRLADTGDLDITTPEKRESVIRKNRRNVDYHFGKYTLLTGWYAMQWMKQDKMFAPGAEHAADGEEPATAAQEADYFINALRNAKVDLSNLQIIVLELNDYNRNDSSFTDALRRAAADAGNPEWIRSMRVLDVGQELSDDLYFLLDSHITAEGHEVVAKRLYEVIGE